MADTLTPEKLDFYQKLAEEDEKAHNSEQIKAAADDNKPFLPEGWIIVSRRVDEPGDIDQRYDVYRDGEVVARGLATIDGAQRWVRRLSQSTKAPRRTAAWWSERDN